MSFQKNFCAGPWFSIRLRQHGNFEACRWGTGPTNKSSHNIANTSIVEFHRSPFMSNIRQGLLNGEELAMCADCRRQDRIGQLSGRWRQQLKVGVRQDDFVNTVLSSTALAEFEYSATHSGGTQLYPMDLQVDLGNFCNNSCIMCDPISSSRVAADYIKLSKINPDDFEAPTKVVSSWATQPSLVEKFIDELRNIPNIRYIHFLGGETLVIDAFWNICNALVAAGVSKNIIVGTTTNGTVFDERVAWLCSNFKEVHLGVSVETLTPLNDYVRYGSNINDVASNIKQFLALREQYSTLNVVLRTTLSVLTITHYDTLLRFMIEHNVTAESCNILRWPECLQVELLPEELRRDIVNRLTLLKQDIVVNECVNTSANVRLSGTENQQTRRLVDEAISLLMNNSFSDEYTHQQQQKLVVFLKSFEKLRNNNVLAYLPEYEDFLRSIGY